MLPIPCLYLVLAVVLGVLSPAIDRSIATRVDSGVGVDAARDLLTSTATGMIAFTGLVVASVLLVVQFAASQYSPRLVLWFRSDLLIKNAVGSFLAAPLFALVALREIERGRLAYSLDVTLLITLALLIGAAVLFLALLQRVLDRLRPRSVYAGVARQGVLAARAIYPLLLEDSPAGAAGAPGAEPSSWRDANPRELRLRHGTGVVSSFDSLVLIAAATSAGVTIELVPGIGEFVWHGQALLRIHGRGSLDEKVLRSAIVVSDERTIEQDPAFAIRMIVDTALRALSPAVNDPTTAVQAIDALEVFTRELAARDLESSLAVDERGQPRLVWRTAGWADLLDLAFEEIRDYGAGSVQICRRLRALLEDLRTATPAVRHAAIDVHLARLQAAIEEAYAPGSPALAVAAGADRTGIGLRRRR